MYCVNVKYTNYTVKTLNFVSSGKNRPCTTPRFHNHAPVAPLPMLYNQIAFIQIFRVFFPFSMSSTASHGRRGKLHALEIVFSSQRGR